MRQMKFLARPLSLVLLTVWLSPAFADSREISCESHHHSRNLCQTGRHGDVHLIEQTGWSNCEEGKSWGTEDEGVWVDNGCRARFRVDDENQKHKSHHTAAIVAGVAGAAILGALLLGHSNSSKASDTQDEDADSSDRVVGNYQGFDARENSDVSMQLFGNGRVVETVNRRRVEGTMQDGYLRMQDGNQYRVEQTRRGLRLYSQRSRGNVIDLVSG